MSRLSELSAHELAEETKRRAQEAQETDARLGPVLAGLLATVEELERRLDEHE